MDVTILTGIRTWFLEISFRVIIHYLIRTSKKESEEEKKAWKLLNKFVTRGKNGQSCIVRFKDYIEQQKRGSCEEP